jgi:uncharacterized membrane protein (DUF373 family)
MFMLPPRLRLWGGYVDGTERDRSPENAPRRSASLSRLAAQARPVEGLHSEVPGALVARRAEGTSGRERVAVRTFEPRGTSWLSRGPSSSNRSSPSPIEEAVAEQAMPSVEPTHDPVQSASAKVVRFVKGFERIVAFTLLVLLMIVVTLTTFELAVLTFRDLSLARWKLLDVEQMLDLFGFFLLVLVGTELLASLKEYVRVGAVQMEVVFEVALVALAQKVIILNPVADPVSQFGLAALILALAGSFWFVRSTRRRHEPPSS